jgi:hypothetical protein
VRERVNGVAVDCRRAGEDVPESVAECEAEDGGRDYREMLMSMSTSSEPI